MNIFIEKLKKLVQELKSEGKTEFVIMNALKDYLHYAILDFVYNHRDYSHLVMYGGTLLRIGYGLPRMSEDLDFQTGKKFDFGKFRNDIITHFKKTFGADIDVTVPEAQSIEKSTETRFIRFPFLKELELDHLRTVLRIRFDVNYFPDTAHFDTETIPITKDTFAFAIRTYAISTLMASKVSAVLLRTRRGIGKEMSDCKPRDIYDLMWYMDKKIMPNLEYIKARGIPVKNLIELFDIFTHRVVNLKDNLFKADMANLFYNPYEYDDWHRNWRDRFMMLRNKYEIFKIKKIDEIYFTKAFDTNIRYFTYDFLAEPENIVRFKISLNVLWYTSSAHKIHPHFRRKDIESLMAHDEKIKLTDLDYEYAGLFYTKIEDYLKRNDYIVLQPELKTKIIRATGENLNVKTQILLDRRLLERINFESLL